MLKNVLDGPSLANLASRLAVLPASLSPLGTSALKAETRSNALAVAQMIDFLKFIKISTFLIGISSLLRRRLEYLF